MAKIKFTQGELDEFQFILSTRNHTHLGQIRNVDKSTVNANFNMNAADEFSFNVYKEFNGVTEPLWDDIVDLRFIYVPQVDDYFQITVETNDEVASYKTITATSACEAELSQTILYGVEINTEDDIARDEYTIPTVFYRDLSGLDPSSEKYEVWKGSSLLHRILDKAPHYSIGHVDSSVANQQRSFSIDGTSIYDFFVGDCAEQFNCIFLFDSVDRTVNVYDLYTVCQNTQCNYRGDFSDVCPECGGTDLKYYGDDTLIYVDSDNLSSSIKFTTDVDSIKNTFKLEAGDDDMTAAVINLNPNGSQYMYYFSDEQYQDMSDELVTKIKSYDVLYDSYTTQYEALTEKMYNDIDWILYYTSGMMPGVLDPDQPDTDEGSRIVAYDSTSAKEAAKLTIENLSPIGMEQVIPSTSVSTVNNALKAYAKVYVKSGYFKVEVANSEFTYIGAQDDGYNYGSWTGNFKVTNYSDETDVAYSNTITVVVYNKFEEFVEQKIEKQLAKDSEDDDSIYDVLSIQDYDTFVDAIKLYSLNRLGSFYDAIQSILDILSAVDEDKKGDDFYDDFYLPWFKKLQATASENDVRQAQIDARQESYDGTNATRLGIQKILNFESYLGTDLWKEFCSYRREDTYQNSNFISDGMTNAEIFDNAREFLKDAREEIVKSGDYQHSISATLYDLLAMDEFTHLADSFELGNWIRVGVNEKVYRLRLTKYSVNNGDLTNLDVEFSDLTQTANGMNDIKSILSSAQNMATSYGAVEKQSEKGDDASTTIDTFRNEGLNASLYSLTSDDNEQVTFDTHGLLCRKYDDITETYSDEQFRLNNNVLSFTSDNWEHVRSALGQQSYTLDGVTHSEYGLNADFCIASTIIGGDIYSDNYSSETGSLAGTHINLSSGHFSFAGGKISYDGNTLELIDCLISNGEGAYELDSNGKLLATDAIISGDITVNTGYIGSEEYDYRWIIGNDADRAYIYSGITSMTDTENTSGVYVGTDGIRSYDANDDSTTETTIQDGVLTTNNIVITGGKVNIGNVSISATGAITSNNPSTKSYAIINNGYYYIYGTKNSKAIKTLAITSVGSANNYDGISIICGHQADVLSFGVADSDVEGTTVHLYYMINNGMNPSGYTQRHIFHESEMHTGVCNFSSSVTMSNTLNVEKDVTISESLYCKNLYGKTLSDDGYHLAVLGLEQYEIRLIPDEDDFSRIALYVNNEIQGYVTLTPAEKENTGNE